MTSTTQPSASLAPSANLVAFNERLSALHRVEEAAWLKRSNAFEMYRMDRTPVYRRVFEECDKEWLDAHNSVSAFFIPTVEA